MGILCGKDEDLRLDTRIQEIAEQIRARQLWKRLYDCDDREHGEAIVADLRANFSDARSQLLLDEIKPKATKDLDEGAELLERAPDGVYARTQDQRNWLDVSKIIAALKKEERVVRIYLANPDHPNRPDMRRKAREYGERHRTEVV